MITEDYITEDYCSYEVAKLLKEKGFNENTICKYADVGGITERWYDDYRERVLRFDWEEGYLIEPSTEPKDQYEIIGDTISAPTLQMAMKWLREKHIIIAIQPEYFGVESKCSAWGCDIWADDNYEKLQDDFPTYEEATEAAIKYCLENLI